MSAPARSLESAGGDLSQRNRLVRVMTEETSIKKFAGLPSGLWVRIHTSNQETAMSYLNRPRPRGQCCCRNRYPGGLH
jgi:hypothetical protein